MTYEHVPTFEQEVIDRLARIETHVESAAVRLSDHEVRVRSLERRQWLLAGAAAALGPFLSKLGIHLPLLG
jgi:hypothetical protein